VFDRIRVAAGVEFVVTPSLAHTRDEGVEVGFRPQRLLPLEVLAKRADDSLGLARRHRFNLGRPERSLEHVTTQIGERRRWRWRWILASCRNSEQSDHVST
jgi:hypothetical protein